MSGVYVVRKQADDHEREREQSGLSPAVDVAQMRTERGERLCSPVEVVRRQTDSLGRECDVYCAEANRR